MGLTHFDQEGNAVMVETARYYVGSVLIGGLAGYLICIFCLGIRNSSWRES